MAVSSTDQVTWSKFVCVQVILEATVAEHGGADVNNA
jgi:hypothetical protein